MKLAWLGMLLLPGCAGQSVTQQRILSNDEARKIEAKCGLPANSIVIQPDGDASIAEPGETNKLALERVGCFIGEAQKRHVRMGRIGFISKPPEVQ